MKRKIVVFMLILAVFPLLAQGDQDAGATSGGDQPTVRVAGAFRGEEALRFEECLVAFEEATGIDVIYEGSPEFETQIIVQTEAGTPPDVAALPQPGLMKYFAEGGNLVPLWPEALARLDANYTQAWKDLGSFDGKVYGVFHRVNAKSFVWYPKKAFEAKGYSIPKTWDELLALADQIVADGGVPFSVGIESGGATGWAATDWMEDIVLRTAGPEVYDRWINHEIPFDHPAIVTAAEKMAEIWLNPDYVYGGASNILTTNFGDAVLPLFENPPKAWLHRQGNFIVGFMPDAVQASLEDEVGVFALPMIEERWGTPVLGGGDQFVVFNDTPEVRKFVEYLTTWESAAPWAAAGGALFPHQDQKFSDYGSTLEADLARILVAAEVFRFDASDLMPGEVGAGTFWTGMTELVGGEPIKSVLKGIDESWP